MANTIAEAWGHDTVRVKTAHRLGSKMAEVRAATWKTAARAVVNKDGSGYVTVTRSGLAIHQYEFGPENEIDEQ